MYEQWRMSMSNVCILYKYYLMKCEEEMCNVKMNIINSIIEEKKMVMKEIQMKMKWKCGEEAKPMKIMNSSSSNENTQ